MAYILCVFLLNEKLHIYVQKLVCNSREGKLNWTRIRTRTSTNTHNSFNPSANYLCALCTHTHTSKCLPKWFNSIQIHLGALVMSAKRDSPAEWLQTKMTNKLHAENVHSVKMTSCSIYVVMLQSLNLNYFLTVFIYAFAKRFLLMHAFRCA